MSETIELQVVKPKRVYKKKVPVESPQSDADSECVEPHTTRLGGEPQLPVLSLEVPESVGPSVKPKRTYTRKPKVVQLEDVILSVPPPPALVRQSNEPRIRLTTELIDTPPSSPKAVAEPVVKKPRTEKQIAAFNKMRDARLAKQAELTRLKELEREEKRIDSEKSKLDKVTEQVINKVTEIKKKRASRKKEVVEEVEPVLTEPQQIPIIREKTYKPIVFV